MSSPRRMRVFFGTITPDMPGGIYVTETAFQQACAAGGEVEVVPLAFGRRRPDETALERVVMRLADWCVFAWRVVRERPDLVHLNTAFDRRALVRDVGYALIASLLRQPLFLKCHGSDAALLTTRSAFWRWMTRTTIAGARGIGVLSSEEKRNFVAAGFAEDRFHVVRNAVDAAPFAGAVWPRPGPPSLLFMARLVPGKGLEDVIRAVGLLADRGREVKLTVVGDGPVRPSAEALARELGMTDRITFAGFIEERAAARFYMSAWLLAFPSHSEGFSMTIFQAVAAGMPIVTTRIRAAADYLREPDHVRWVEPGRPDRVATEIEWLLDHPEAMAAMSAANRALAGSFAAGPVAAEYVAIYRRLADGRRGASGA